MCVLTRAKGSCDVLGHFSLIPEASGQTSRGSWSRSQVWSGCPQGAGGVQKSGCVTWGGFYIPSFLVYEAGVMPHHVGCPVDTGLVCGGQLVVIFPVFQRILQGDPLSQAKNYHKRNFKVY